MRVSGGTGGPGTGGQARFDHLHVNNVNMAGIWFYNNLRGVADHIVYDGLVGQHMQNVVANGSYPDGDYDFTQPAGYGSSDFFFMEDWYIDNAQSNNTSAGGWDAQRGAKYVVRYCWLNCVEVLCHGTEGSRYHGGRAYELYNNHYIWDNNTTSAMDGIRSGTMIAHDNRFSGPFKKSGWGMQTYRTFHNFGGNWGGATGLNEWDSNDGVVYVSGTCTAGTVSVPGGAITVVDNTKNMTPGQYVSYQISKPDGFMMRVNSNTATTFVGTDQGLGGSLFNVGDTYVVMRPLVCIDQPNRGAGDLVVQVITTLVGAITLPAPTVPVASAAAFPTHGVADINGDYFHYTGKTANSLTGCTGGSQSHASGQQVQAAKNNVSGEQTWTRQVIEPCYEWNNIYTPDGTPLQGMIYQANAPMTPGVDYFTDHRAMPGYTPFVYPHPLVTGSAPPPPPPTKIIVLTGNLAFGTVVIGSASPTSTLTVANQGNTLLTVTAVSYPTGFTGPTTGFTVASGSSFDMVVTFTPLLPQLYSGNITVTSDATSGTNTIACSGTGINSTPPVHGHRRQASDAFGM